MTIYEDAVKLVESFKTDIKNKNSNLDFMLMPDVIVQSMIHFHHIKSKILEAAGSGLDYIRYDITMKFDTSIIDTDNRRFHLLRNELIRLLAYEGLSVSNDILNFSGFGILICWHGENENVF